MSSLHLRRRIAPSLAWLAIVGLCFWPVAASANCCCQRAPAESVTDSVAIPPCCAHTASADDQTCPSTATTTGCDGDGSCQCELRCCDDSVVEATLSPNSARDYSLALIDHTPGVLIASMAAPAVSDVASDRFPWLAGIDAHDRCVLLCRWRN